MERIACIRKSILGYLPTEARIRDSTLHRMLGQSLFSKGLWDFNEQSIAGGLCLGLFVAFTPTIPFQMVLTALGAVRFRVNLPVALAACWATNPLTALPIYLLAWQIGRCIMCEFPWIERLLGTYNLAQRLPAFLLQGTYLWTGCLILATLAGSTAHLAVRLVCRRCMPPDVDSDLKGQAKHAQMVHCDD